jgi:hypothetical protein
MSSTPPYITRTDMPEPIADTEGTDLRPDLGKVTTPGQLVLAMRQYRTWAGEPSYAEMARCIRGAEARSTLQRAVRADHHPGELPRLAIVTAFIAGCGGRQAEQERWATCWRRLAKAGFPVTGTAHQRGRS